MKLRWISVAIGFLLVVRHVEKYLEKSAWYRIFEGAVPADQGWTVSLASAEGIYAEFLGKLLEFHESGEPSANLCIGLCDIGTEDESNSNIYHGAVKDLFALLQLERVSMHNLPQVMSFLGRLNDQFQQSLIDRDAAALLILLHWFAVVKGLGAWWATARINMEARAILGYLELNTDARVQRLLIWPREAFHHAAKPE